jgi:hypothetical protein
MDGGSVLLRPSCSVLTVLRAETRLIFGMGRAIRIIAGDVVAAAELNDTRAATAIWTALPLEARGQTWGDEIYFGIGIQAEAEASKAVVALGDLAYWPPGSAFCIFFGPTPMSQGNEIRPASPVTVVGRVAGDPSVFKKVAAGTMVRLERQDRGTR